MHRVLWTVMLVLAVAASAFGQAGGTGSIEGQVLDQGGALIPDVTVMAVNTATQSVTTAVTNSVGNYALLRLQPGTYTLSVEHAGFKKLERTGILVQVGDRISLDLTLQVGQTSESISVTGEAPAIRTEDAQTGEVINNQMISNLPQLNRDPLALIKLAANVQGDGDRAVAGSSLRINGGRTQGIDYFVDGLTVGTGMAHSVSYNTPTMEAVQEFKVVTNGISAEYGRISGGAVELVTKSGSNAYHGQVFEYLENRAFNANSWFNNLAGQEKANFQQNIWGGAIGGPVSIPKVYDGKDKTFFFFNYQGYAYRQGGALQYGSVPTEAMRKGDFTNVCLRGTCAMLYDQDGPVALESDGKYYRQALLGGDGLHVPVSQMNPVAVAALQFVPLPNHEPNAGTTWENNYVGLANVKRDGYDWALRIDQQLTPNQRIFGRFSTHHWVDDPLTRWFGPGQSIAENKNEGMFAQTLNYDWTISPTLLFNARAGFNFTPYTTGTSVDPSVMQALPFDSLTKSLLGASGSVQLWAPNMTPMVDSATTNVANSTAFDVNFNFVKILQKHMLKFGYENRRYYDNFTNGSNAYMLTTGRTVKRGAFDSGWNDEDYVDSFAGFLQGYISHQGAFGQTTRAMAFNYYGSWIQDDWRITPKLTIGLGLRWDMESPVTERHDKLYFWDPDAPSTFTMVPGYNWNAELQKGLTAAGFDPALASSIPTPSWAKSGFLSGAARVANSPEFPSRYGTSYDPWHFSPRVSAAYSIDNKTVVRGSFGMMYLSRSGDQNALSTAGGAMALSDSYGELWHVNDPTVPYYKMSQTLTTPYRPTDLKHYIRDNYLSNVQVTGGDPTLIAYDMSSHMPHEYAWNFNIQRQIGGNFVVELGYVGNKGVDLLAQDQIGFFPASQFVPANANLYNTVTVASPVKDTISGNFQPNTPLPIAIRDFPYYGPVGLQGINFGRSMYNAGTARLEKRMSHGYSFLFNYTYGKGLDNVGGPDTSNAGIVSGGTGGHTPQSLYSIKDVYGVSPLDRTHVMRLYYTVELPFGKGRFWLGNPQGVGGKMLDFAVGGWDIAGLSSWSSGVPINIPGSNANNKPSRVEYIWSAYTTTDHDLSSSSYDGQSSVFYSQQVDPSVRAAGPHRLDGSKLINPDQAGGIPFLQGNIDPIYPYVRQPWAIYHDLSLMKKFPITERVFLQFRMEAQNVFNMRGWPNYITDPRSADYGLMVADPNNNTFNHSPRTIQMSARIVF